VGSVKRIFAARVRIKVQGHPRSLILVRIESAYASLCDFLLGLVRPILYRFRYIAGFLHLAPMPS